MPRYLLPHTQIVKKRNTVAPKIIHTLCLNTAAMVEWLRCSTRIHKVLCSNLSITIHGMTLDKSLTAQLSRMTHSYHTEYIISQYVGRKGVQILPSVKRKKTIETGCMWTLIITAAGPNG